MILFIAIVLAFRPSPLTVFDSPRATRTFDLEFFQQSPLFITHAAPFEQFRPPQPGPAQRLLQSPAMDRRVIARHQHRRNRLPVDHRRPRVVRPVHKPSLDRSLTPDSALLIGPGNSLANPLITTNSRNSPPESTEAPTHPLPSG